MVEQEPFQRLYRAWILVTAAQEEIAAVQEQIAALNEKLPKPQQRIVRIDMVDDVDGGLGVNLVAPVWALEPEGVHEIREMIQGLGVKDAQVLMVHRDERIVGHFPIRPHEAEGYITLEETNPVNPGPTGINAWG
jgi:hypothetical protein